ncbi:MAG TPA: hypothetical protein VIT68_05255 [Candidatus Gracilibacteria bacterium]
MASPENSSGGGSRESSGRRERGRAGKWGLVLTVSTAAALGTFMAREHVTSALQRMGIMDETTVEVVEPDEELTGMQKLEREDKHYALNVNTKGSQQTATVVGRNNDGEGFHIHVEQDDAGQSAMVLPGLDNIDGNQHTRLVVTNEDTNFVAADAKGGFENPNTYHRAPAPAPEAAPVAPTAPAEDTLSSAERKAVAKMIKAGRSKAAPEDGLSDTERDAVEAVVAEKLKAHEVEIKRIFDELSKNFDRDVTDDITEERVGEIVKENLPKGSKPLTDEQIQQVADYISEHYGVDLSADTLAVWCSRGRSVVSLPGGRASLTPTK